MTQYGIYLSAAGSLAAEARMDVIANNLANLDTPGFKRAFAVFQQRPTEAFEPPRYEPSVRRPVLDRIGGGLFVHETTYDGTLGRIEQTGNALDVALTGEGWFTIQVDGRQLYTRAGNFARSPSGQLVTADGKGAVLDQQGRAIQIPATGQLEVDATGTLRADGAELGQLWVQGAVDYQRFRPVGDNRYEFVGEGKPETLAPAVLQGAVERSTVEPVQEMVAMIRTFRAYEANQRMITQQDQALGRAVNDVGRVGQ